MSKKKTTTIFTNHTLEEFKEKYDIDNCTYISKSVVDAYNKKHKKKPRNYLLEGRVWWLINDTYYEVHELPDIPNNYKKPKVHSNKVKIIVTCTLGAIALAAAITLGVLIINRAVKEDKNSNISNNTNNIAYNINNNINN